MKKLFLLFITLLFITVSCDVSTVAGPEDDTTEQNDGSGTDGSGTDGSGTDGSGTDGSGTDGSGTDGSGTDGSGTDGSGTDGSGTDGSGTDPIVISYETDFTLLSGQTGKGFLNENDTHNWSFYVNEGQYIAITAGDGVNTSDVNVSLRLVDPTGTLVGSGTGTYGKTIYEKATVSGNYTVEITDSLNNASGEYTVSLTLSGGSLTVSQGDEGGPIASGATVDGYIHYGDNDGWTFHANQGDYIAVTAGDGTEVSDTNVSIYLVDPSGTVIGSGNGDEGKSIYREATVTGEYTIIVSDNLSNAVGNYKLSLVVSGGNLSITSGDEGGPISSGSTVDGYIHYGDNDGWTFHAEQGDYIAVTAGDGTEVSATNVSISLVDPSGNVLGSGTGDEGKSIYRQATENGYYTIIVSDNLCNAVGSYKLSLVVSGGNLSITSGDEGGPIASGATVDGYIHYGDNDGWTFYAEQGDYIAVSAGDGDALSDTNVSIYLVDPVGTLLGTGIGDEGKSLFRQATVSGYYTIIVSDNLCNAVGNYKLSLVVSGGNLSITSGDEGGPITPGSTVTGYIHYGDNDGWTFNVTTADAITVTVEDGTANADINANIYFIDPQGTLLGSGTGESSYELTRYFTTSGVYTVVVSDNLCNAQGYYKLRVDY